MLKVNVCVRGCDDETNTQLEVSPNQHEFLLFLAQKLNQASKFGCMPKMFVSEVKDEANTGE